MRNIDLIKYKDFASEEQCARKTRENVLLDQLCASNCFELGVEKLEEKTKEAVGYELCQGHDCEGVKKDLTRTVLGEVAWAVERMATRAEDEG